MTKAIVETTLGYFKTGSQYEFSYYYNLLNNSDKEEVLLTILESNEDMQFVKSKLSSNMLLDLALIRNKYKVAA